MVSDKHVYIKKRQNLLFKILKVYYDNMMLNRLIRNSNFVNFYKHLLAKFSNYLVYL